MLTLETAKTPHQVEATKPAPIVWIQPKPQPNFDRDVLIPLQKKQAEEAAAGAARAEAARLADLKATADRMQPAWTYGNSYAALNCTAYVASRIPVPQFMGNASNWSYGLSAAGWRSGAPRRGAVGISHAGWAGHVVVVEGVTGDFVHISEYNYTPFSYSERDVPASDFQYFY